MNKKRYQEEYEEGSNLLWPSEEEDKITRKFYRDLSHLSKNCLLYTSPSPRDATLSRMPSSA